MKVGHTYGEKWPEKVVQRSFIKEHSFPNSLYMNFTKFFVFKHNKMLLNVGILVILNILGKAQ